MDTQQMFLPATMLLLHDLIPRIASKRRKYYKGVSRDDLEGCMWVAAVEAAGRVEALSAAGAVAPLEALLTRAATAAQAAEEREYRAKKALRAGYAPRDEQFYSIGALRRLMPAYLDGGVSEQPPQGRDGSSAARPTGAESYGDWLCTMMDLDTAMRAISAFHRRTLEDYFQYPQGSGGWSHLEISSALGLPPETVKKRVYRALRALQRALGGESPYRGDRSR
jgi:hypothetical protein